jgi:hypothetical protein
MGYERHHAIIVSGWSREDIEAAHAGAVRIFDEEVNHRGYGLAMVTPVMDAPANGLLTFFVGPDGSKEAYERSRLSDERRAEFVAWLRTQLYESDPATTPPTCRLAWVEVQYGGETRIVHDSDEALRAWFDADSDEASTDH